MEKKMNNEELQSRREFFKKAAKGALPILAAVALTNVPSISSAINTPDPQSCSLNSCSYTCSGSCSGTCGGGCGMGCTGGCRGGCGGCRGACQASCSGNYSAFL